MEYWWAYILAGLVCGIVSAMFGVGSGIIMIPVLALAFSLPQKSAQGVALAVMVPMALVGAIRYKLNPEIEMDMGIVAWLAAGAVVGALVGTGFIGSVSGTLLRRLFAIIMIIVAVKMLLTTDVAGRADAVAETRLETKD